MRMGQGEFQLHEIREEEEFDVNQSHSESRIFVNQYRKSEKQQAIPLNPDDDEAFAYHSSPADRIKAEYYNSTQDQPVDTVEILEEVRQETHTSPKSDFNGDSNVDQDVPDFENIFANPNTDIVQLDDPKLILNSAYESNQNTQYLPESEGLTDLQRQWYGQMGTGEGNSKGDVSEGEMLREFPIIRGDFEETSNLRMVANDH